jgi:hypothetical protein
MIERKLGNAERIVRLFIGLLFGTCTQVEYRLTRLVSGQAGNCAGACLTSATGLPGFGVLEQPGIFFLDWFL